MCRYRITSAGRPRWHCDRDTHVFSFLLPRGYQARPGSDTSDDWEPQESEAIIHYITQIPESVQAQMRSVTGYYRNDFSKTTQSFYWMNHYEHCGMMQGDFELFEEFDTPFCPINPQDASRILLRAVREAFEAPGRQAEDDH